VRRINVCKILRMQPPRRSYGASKLSEPIILML
jgi:hypothetical protein